MAIKIISLSILLTLLMVQIKADGEKEDKLEQCQVFSAKYRRFMLARHKVICFESERRIHADDYRDRSFLDIILGRDYKIEYSESNPSGVWIFEPVIDRKGAYYLRNQKYSDDYLKGSSSYIEWIFKENFHVSATKKHDDSDEFYMWRFNQTSTSSDIYYIWNVKNGSPMYTRRMNNFMISLIDGSIGEDSQSFEWYIKCKYDLLPRYIGF